ncbi:threonine--tRNA ligase [Candidatus Pacearchaeota archaeon RBG_16_35_8]|nr:MAG: threonine--tRNA ligase [Candidatus Pacearchaeota archaeon RBG_16_35_8]
MKILTLHVDYINFKPLKKALKNVEELSDKEKKGGEAKDALVVMTAIEKIDDNVKEVTKKFVDAVKDVASQVKTKNIVLYPYAHLSSNLASPELASEVLTSIEKELKKDFDVLKAPFGYYKEFELKVKGHPLSELSREIQVDGEVKSEKSGRIKAEEKYDYKQLLREISKSKLDTSKLKDNDHRIIGKEMELFSFSEVAPGMVFWHNNGLIIRTELIDFWRQIHRKSGYQEILTPQMMDSKLWKVSGHWDKYKDNNFISEYEKRPFILKPMNCPGGMLVYRNTPKSYADLPLRVAEMGVVHRVELSGVLSGLFRVIQFTQDDAHLFCADEKQAKEEIKKIVELINFFYKKFNLNFDHVELCTRPEKRIGTDEMWGKAEKLLESTLKELKVKYILKKGDGAFYGPKIDFHVKDSLDRTWQVSTIQLDFSMPERFELEYTDKDNTKKRPIMLHRVIYGSLERFIGILLEHTNGRLPTWLAPNQVRVLSFTDRNIDYARQVIKKLGDTIPELRLDADLRSTTVQSKVKEAEIMRVPWVITVGDNEEKNKTISVRHESKVKYDVKIDSFIKDIKELIKKRK